MTVEPDSDQRCLLHYFLDRLGYRTLQTHSAEKAVEALVTAPADAVLVSALLPDMSIEEFALRLRTRRDRAATFR